MFVLQALIVLWIEKQSVSQKITLAGTSSEGIAAFVKDYKLSVGFVLVSKVMVIFTKVLPNFFHQNKFLT